MRDLDDYDYDPYPPGWHAAPPPKRTPGPIIEAYVDTNALDHDCTNCHASEGEFCKHPDGTDRKMPCLERITTASRTSQTHDGGCPECGLFQTTPHAQHGGTP